MPYSVHVMKSVEVLNVSAIFSLKVLKCKKYPLDHKETFFF